jgi:DNA replication initiation complex subunit (GINS family)
MSEIKITLEGLYDILRREKKSEDLQGLDSTFFVDVVSYLREKIALLDNIKESDDMFASSEKEKLEYEIRSIKRILKEIYEKREKKIIEIALNKSRTRSDIIDSSSMLNEEKDFYQRILGNLDLFRSSVLVQLFKADLPKIITREKVVEKTIDRIKKEEIESKKVDVTTKKVEVKVDVNVEKKGVEESKAQVEKQESEIKSNAGHVDIRSMMGSQGEMTKVEFLHSVPSFVWKDMKEYGPFEQGETSEVFNDIATLLVRKGRAKEV